MNGLELRDFVSLLRRLLVVVHIHIYHICLEFQVTCYCFYP